MRNVTRQLGRNSRGYLGQPAIRVRLVGRARDGRDEPHHAAVRAMSGERVPKQIPLDCEFIGDDLSALLKSVIHEATMVAKLEQRAVDAQRKPLDRSAASSRCPKSSLCRPPPGRHERGECTASPLRWESYQEM